MKNIGRRSFLKVGAVGSGIAAGSSSDISHAYTRGRHMRDHHHSGKPIELEPELNTILKNGLSELLSMTEGLDYKTLPPKEYIFPLSLIAYDELPEPETMRKDVEDHMDSDPVGILEKALALFELYACNQKKIEEDVPSDSEFFSDCFGQFCLTNTSWT